MPFLTSIEKGVVNKLIGSLSATESHFCCGGVIKLPVGQKLKLLYKVGDQDQARSLELPPSRSDETDKLLDACLPSYYGRGKETVYDESYLLARELKQDTFALTTDILDESGVLTSIAALTSPSNASNGITAHLHKLNAYATGGFFKPHRDTPKSDRHIGTLVVALPVSYTGGALCVSREGKQVMFDWGGKFYQPQEQVALQWAFLFSDVEHEVLPVTSGTCVMLAYDILALEEDPSPAPLAMDGTSLPFYTDLKDALSNKDFLPRGGCVALALSHQYPVNMNTDSSGFASRLKGSDAALHRALAALGIPIELRAVFSVRGSALTVDHHIIEELADLSDEEFGPSLAVEQYSGTERYSGTEQNILYTSKSFAFLEGSPDLEYGEDELISECYGGQIEPDLIWAHKPTEDVFSKSGYFVEYGNQAELCSLYVATALVLDVPAVGQLARVSVENSAVW